MSQITDATSEQKCHAYKDTRGRTLANMWTGGRKDDTSGVTRPCDCGCSNGPWVGYLCISNTLGQGVTIYIYEETEYRALRRTFGGEE